MDFGYLKIAAPFITGPPSINPVLLTVAPQFLAGFSICWMAITSTGAVVDFTSSPSCSWSAVNSDGPEDSEDAAPLFERPPIAVVFIPVGTSGVQWSLKL